MKPSRVLAYHKVDERMEWGITRSTPGQFRRHIAAIVDAGYRLVTLGEWFDHQQDESLVALTFDDGYESVYQHALPILEQYDARATIFVITNYIGTENTWDVNYGGLCFRHLREYQIREMALAGHEFASHTHNHSILTRISHAQLRRELAMSKNILESLTGSPVQFVAYPFARYNGTVVQSAMRLGYQGGAIYMRACKGMPASDTRLIYRQGVYRTDSVRSVLSKLRPGPAFQWQRLKQNLINWAAGLTIFILGNNDRQSTTTYTDCMEQSEA